MTWYLPNLNNQTMKGLSVKQLKLLIRRPFCVVKNENQTTSGAAAPFCNRAVES